MQSIYFPSSNGESNIHAGIWIPKQQPIAAILLIHGMTEHVGRYDRFIAHLNKCGVAVFGIDLPGHGKSVASSKDYGYFGKRNAGKTLCDDIHTLRGIMSDKCPNIPYFMLGHSMGSFVLRRYLIDRAEGLAGVILSGTGDSPKASRGGLFFVRILRAICGEQYRSKFFDQLAFSNYNERLPNEPKGSRAWLCRDAKVVRTYEEDDACGFVFTVSAYADMIKFTREVNTPKWFQTFPKELPILFFSGDADPVGQYGEGVQRVYNQLLGSGANYVRCILYSGGRHDMLNDINCKQVYKDIQDWMLNRNIRHSKGMERTSI